MIGRLAVALLLASSALVDASAAQPAAERDRIASERAAAKARLTEQERTCREQFVVTACLEAARKDERATLARLRRAEIVLDDADRREAAARRRQSIQERAAAKLMPASDAASASRRRDEPRPAPTPHSVPTPRAAADGAQSDAAARATEQRNVDAYETRLRAQRAHRAEVEKRNAARAATGKVAAPLPAASAP